MKRILRYLKHTMDYSLTIAANSTLILAAFSYVDWAGCPDDKKSMSIFCIFLRKNIISWSSKKQPTITRSSTEIEYKAIANANNEFLWIQSLLSMLGILLPQPPTLYCDNLGVTYLSVL